MNRRVLLKAAAAAALIAAGLLWVFQAGLLKFALNRFSARGFSVAGVDGTLAAGYRLTGLSWKGPGLELSVPELLVVPGFSVAGARPLIKEVRASSPAARLPAGGAGGGGPFVFPGWLPAVELAEVSSGSLTLPGGKEVTDINCALSYKERALRVETCSGRAEGLEASFGGGYAGSTAAAEGRLTYPPAAAELKFSYEFAPGSQSFLAGGLVGGAPVSASGRANGAQWSASVVFERLMPLRLVKPELPDLPVRSARISASGRGFDPAGLSAAGAFSVDQGPGASAAGKFKFREGSAEAEAEYSARAFSAGGRAALAGEKLSGSWHAASTAPLRVPLGEGSALLKGFKAGGTIGGTLAVPELAARGELAGLESGGLKTGPAALEASVSGRKAERAALKLTAERPSLNGRELDSARLEAEGSAERNRFSAVFVYNGSTVAAGGTSSYAGGVWSAVLESLAFSAAPDWRLCGPAGLSYSKLGGAAVSGLCLASGQDRALLSGRSKGGFPEELHLELNGLELARLGSLGPAGMKPGGLVNASADYISGDGPGRLRFSAAGLTLNGMELGDFTASGEFGPRELEVAAARWSVYGGAVEAAGKIRYGEEVSTEFSIRASTVNVAPLLVFAPGLAAREIWLNGESSVSASGRNVKTSGQLLVTSPRLAAPGLGLDLDDVRLELSAGDLSSALLRGSTGKKSGSAAVEGRLSPAGPEIRIRSGDLPFDHPSGVSGRAGVDLLFSGTWAAPDLGGTVELNSAALDMGKWNKYRPAAEKSRFYESMAMDLKVNADRNVWYRDGASAVEMKGTLLVKKEPYRQPAAVGSVEALKGYYVYLGNTFTVTSGSLLFTGETPPNPGIEAAAAIEERNSPIKVYVNITGKLRSPQVTLSSDPAMEQRDIISYLVTGKPLYQLYSPGQQQAGAPGAAGPGMAQSIAAGYLSQKAATTVAKKLEMDVINLKLTQERQADITVGRYVTRDFFISYGQVLGQGGEKRVSAEYSISRHWSMEGKNSSDGRYVADLLFKFGIR